MEKYKRKTACISGEELKKIDFFAKEGEHIEVSIWHNGEGFDVEICSALQQRFQLTWGEYDALKKLIVFLNEK